MVVHKFVALLRLDEWNRTHRSLSSKLEIFRKHHFWRDFLRRHDGCDVYKAKINFQLTSRMASSASATVEVGEEAKTSAAAFRQQSSITKETGPYDYLITFNLET